MLTIHQRLAPRIIQCGGFCGAPILINTSIQAGCKHSVALTRLLLLAGLSDLTVDHPSALPKVYVDDTAQLSAGTAKGAMKAMLLSVLDFVDLIHSLQLYKVRNNRRDLGVGFSFGSTTQRRHLFKNIVKRVNGPLKKMTTLANISRRTRVLFSGAGYSQSTWGFQGSGLDGTDWMHLEIAAANAARFGPRRCRYSALVVSCGVTVHPSAKGIQELDVLWLKLLNILIQEKRALFLTQLADTWQHVLNAAPPVPSCEKGLKTVKALSTI